jgi:alkylhydroperoxidase family enzyme
MSQRAGLSRLRRVPINNGKECAMNARLNLSGSPLAAKSIKYMASASKVVIEDSTLPKSTENMVMLRASQITGCGFCTRHPHQRRRACRRDPGAHQPSRGLEGVQDLHPTPSAPPWS